MVRLVIGAVMQRAARWTLPAALAIGFVFCSVADVQAQVRAASPVIARRPMEPALVLLPDGAYQLTLTPASRDQHTLTATHPITLGANVTHGGNAVTVTTSDGMTLHGLASASHLKASGPVQASTLTLELGGSASTASGTFLLVGRAGHELAGTAAVSPAPRMVAQTSKSGGCHGFWDCVKTITGFDWSVFGG